MPTRPATGEIIAINLRPEFWRRSLGRELLRAAISKLRAAGFAEATLWVLQGNERARRFYEALAGLSTEPNGSRPSSRDRHCTRCAIDFIWPGDCGRRR